MPTKAAEDADAGFASALRRHVRWQRGLLNRTTHNMRQRQHAVRYLVLRPGNKFTVCNAKGMSDVRQHCFRYQSPRGARPDGMHWDRFILNRRRDLTRPIPGLGNVALSLVSAAAVAIASKRVLLLENFSSVGASFGAPLHDLLVETSGWAPHLAAASRLQGGAADGWMAHDDFAAFETLCAADLRRTPAAPVWRIFSNQYFLPLLLLNPHHAPAMESMAEALEGDGGLSLWTPGIRSLWRPRPRLGERIDAFMASSGLAGGAYVAMHVRSNLVEQRDSSRRLSSAVACARSRLAATNSSTLFLATMFSANRRALKEALAPSGIRVQWLGRAIEAQGESREASDGALVDMLLMGRAREVLVTPGSTFGYVAQGLAGRRATVYGGTHTSRELVGPAARDCSSVGTSEPNFHFLKHALRSFSACRVGARAAAARGSALYERSSKLH